MRIEIAGSSPTKYFRSRSTPSTRMSPTSPIVRADPSGLERKTMPAISSGLRFSTPVRTRAFAPCTSPAGSASTSEAMAVAIWVMETSNAIRLADGTSITVCGAAMPRMAVRVTPTANRRVMNSSANRPNWSGPIGPVITTSVTRSRHTPRRTVGSSASPGSVVIASTATRTSSTARAMSQPGSNSNRMRALPSVDVDSVFSTPSTASIAGSSTCTIAASTSSGPAPSHATRTLTVSRMTSGKNCARMLGIATAPSASKITSSRLASVR